MTTYEELFTVSVDEIGHGDPHMLFGELSRVANSRETFEPDFRVLWDSEEREYTFMLEYDS